MHRLVRQAGFTLVEMIVSLAVFSIVITVSVGALLMLIATNQQLQGEQSVMTNLSFALDSMVREMRTGTGYYCDAGSSRTSGSSGAKIFQDGEALDTDVVQNCSSGNSGNLDLIGVSFIESGESITQAANTRIVYFFDRTEGKLYRRISDQAAQSIVSSGIYITDADFYVSGAAPLSAGSTEDDQASITIFIEAREANDSAAETYQIQTSITQRTLDI